jgi:predicted lipase
MPANSRRRFLWIIPAGYRNSLLWFIIAGHFGSLAWFIIASHPGSLLRLLTRHIVGPILPVRSLAPRGVQDDIVLHGRFRCGIGCRFDNRFHVGRVP